MRACAKACEAKRALTLLLFIAKWRSRPQRLNVREHGAGCHPLGARLAHRSSNLLFLRSSSVFLRCSSRCQCRLLLSDSFCPSQCNNAAMNAGCDPKFQTSERCTTPREDTVTRRLNAKPTENLETVFERFAREERKDLEYYTSR